MALQEFCKRPAVTIRPEHTIQEACELMREHNSGCLLVTEADGRLNGTTTGGRPIPEPPALGTAAQRRLRKGVM